MRKLINDYIAKTDCILLHPDLWPFENPHALNCGIIEQTIIDIGIGMTSKHKNVFMYGIAGFLLYKGFESLKLYTDHCKGHLIILNAGANGCYAKGLGKGHQIQDDLYLCKDLNFKTYEPSYTEVLKTLDDIMNDDHKLHFIRLGFDKR